MIAYWLQKKRGFRKGVQWIVKNILDHRWGRDRKISRNQLRKWKHQHKYDTTLASKLTLNTFHTKLDTQWHGRIRIWQRLVYSKIARKLDFLEKSTKPDKRQVYYFKHSRIFKIGLRKTDFYLCEKHNKCLSFFSNSRWNHKKLKCARSNCKLHSKLQNFVLWLKSLNMLFSG